MRGTGFLLPLLLLVAACGQTQAADDIARNIDEAVEATRTQVPAVSEQRAQSAADDVACNALTAYSTGAPSLSQQLEEYAAQQQVAAQVGLNQVVELELTRFR